MYKDYLNKNIEVLDRMNNLDSIYYEVADLFIDTIKNNNKIIFIGNGGSAADSMHIASELVSKYKLERNPFFALPLTSNLSAITAIGNDYDFSYIFSRQIEAYGNKGDILVALSTSGKSSNIIRAIDLAKSKSIKTILITGMNSLYGDINVSIPSNDTDIIQNMYMIFLHIVCEKVERELANENRD